MMQGQKEWNRIDVSRLSFNTLQVSIDLLLQHALLLLMGHFQALRRVYTAHTSLGRYTWKTPTTFNQGPSRDHAKLPK